VFSKSLNDITATIQSISGRINSDWALEPALKLVAAAKRNSFKETAFQAISSHWNCSLICSYSTA
jgi:hypothetical protein